MVGPQSKRGMEVALDLWLRDLGFVGCWAMNSDQEIGGGSGASSRWPLPSYRVCGRLSTLLVVRALSSRPQGLPTSLSDPLPRTAA